jgi:hypothetical protein
MAATACKELVRALPYQIEGEQRRIKTTRRKLSLGTLKSASPSDFGYKFPLSFWPDNVFRVSTQRKQQLELSARAHVKGMDPNA